MTIMSLLAWPITILALIFMAPWARWLLRRAEGQALYPANYGLLLALTTLALSVGTLTLILLLMGLLGLPVDWRIAGLLCLGIGALGLLIRDRRIVLRDTSLKPVPSRPLLMLTRAAWIIIVVIAVLVVFNAVYWPFGIDDAVTIYASFGKAIAASGHLPIGNLYETYPMLVPLGYAFTHQAAGWRDEHLAALIPALLSVGVLGVAYLLGCELRNRATGLIAALLIAITPMYTHWAGVGYVDLPCGFFYGLSGLFLARYNRTRSWPDALLTGIMAGLAAFTKNSGLLVVLPIALFIAYRWWLSRSSTERRAFSVRHVLLMTVGFLVTAGPWYTHTLAMAGVLVPPTGWTWKAGHSLADLFPYLIDNRYFVIGWLFTAGLALTLWHVWRTRGRDAAPMLLVLFYLPFFAIWWALFSYDGRFLLVLTTLIAVMAADVVRTAFKWLSPPRRSLVLRYAVILLVLLALPAVSATVDYKFDLLRHPLMSDADKHRLRLGADRYAMDLYLSTLPSGTRVWTDDLLLPYNADNVIMMVGSAPDAEALRGYDYWVLSPGETLPDWFGNAQPVHSEGGYRLYRLSIDL